MATGLPSTVDTASLPPPLAHDAGFTSGAHSSDAFKATFGLPPVRLVDWGVRWASIDRN